MNNFLKGLKQMRSDLQEAMVEDLGRSKFQTELLETAPIEEYCQHHIDYLDDYMQDVPTDPSVIFTPSHCRIKYEPLGVALVIGSWNYPYFVTLKPLIVAIAAGNCVIVKPSELGPCSGRAIQILVEKYLDQRCYRVILGEIDVGKKLS